MGMKRHCKTYYAQKKLSNAISTLLSRYDLSNHNVLKTVLNSISRNKKSPELLQKYHLGECLIGAMGINKTVQSLGNKKDNETQKIKQIIGSSLLSMKGNGYSSSN